MKSVKFILPLLLAACSTSGTDTAAGKETLAGSWKITEAAQQAVQNPEAHIRFDGARQTVHAGAGCNTVSSNYTAEAGRLNAGGAATTLKLCDDETNALETAIGEALENGKTYQIENGRLTISDDKGKVLLKGIR